MTLSPATGRPRRLTYLTGTRADFGLMRSTLQQLAAQPEFQLEIVATGTHLSTGHGHTVDEIRAAGFDLAAEIPVDVTTRTPESMVQAVGDCLLGVTRVLARDRPDLLVLLGDRGEMLAGAIAALHMGVPTVHIHGGERSGTVDEPIRHAISKLSTWHFVATEESANRLQRMGEDGARIFVVGAPGLDGLLVDSEGPREAAMLALGLPSERPYVLVVFHPVVQQAAEARLQTMSLISAVNALGLPVLWLEPNADAGAKGVLEALKHGTLPDGSRRVSHLERGLFVRAMRHASVMVGNSSAGIIEAASFGIPVINVGDRQRLRERNANVVDVAVDSEALIQALRAAIKRGNGLTTNRYGDGYAGRRIVERLAQLPLDGAWLEKCNAY
jgi:GDP/UDP-N,N'-diacetylbacillosamine 2-epimerase (hydrolysing)